MGFESFCDVLKERSSHPLNNVNEDVSIGDINDHAKYAMNAKNVIRLPVGRLTDAKDATN